VSLAGRFAVCAAAGLLAGCAGLPGRCGADRRTDAQLRILEEILESRDDNDPRLDSEFARLSTRARERMRARYLSLPREARNERGTVVYLLGRDPSLEDWDFLTRVVSEPPCLSLADCAKAPERDEPHPAMGDEVTLAYPALVALRQAGRALERDPSHGPARAVAVAAADSKAPPVARSAARLLGKLSP